MGCGGGGCDAIRHVPDLGSYPCVAISETPDADVILHVQPEVHGNRDLARQVVAKYRPFINKQIAGHRAVIAVAALGGGVGTGTLITVADSAKELGESFVAVVMIPFAFEPERRQRALAEAEALAAAADRVIVMDMERLARFGEGMPLQAALAAADSLAAQAAVTLARLFDTVPVFSVMSQHVYSFSYASHQDPLEAVVRAKNAPLFDLDPDAGKLIICPDAALSAVDSDRLSLNVTNFAGIVPEIISGPAGAGGRGVLVFMPTSFRHS